MRERAGKRHLLEHKSVAADAPSDRHRELAKADTKKVKKLLGK